MLLLTREAVCMSEGKEPLNHVVPVSFVKLRHSASLLTHSTSLLFPGDLHKSGYFRRAIVVNS